MVAINLNAVVQGACWDHVYSYSKHTCIVVSAAKNCKYFPTQVPCQNIPSFLCFKKKCIASTYVCQFIVCFSSFTQIQPHYLVPMKLSSIHGCFKQQPLHQSFVVVQLSYIIMSWQHATITTVCFCLEQHCCATVALIKNISSPIIWECDITGSHLGQLLLRQQHYIASYIKLLQIVMQLNIRGTYNIITSSLISSEHW